MLSRSHHCWCFSLFLTYYGSFAQPLFISPPSWHHTILQAGGVGTHTELSRQVAVEAAGCAWRGQAGWLAGRSWLMCSVPPQWLRHLGSVSAGGGPGWVRDKRCDQGGEGKEQIMTFDFANGPCEAGAWIQFKSYGSKNNHATHTYMPRFSENLKKVLTLSWLATSRFYKWKVKKTIFNVCQQSGLHSASGDHHWPELLTRYWDTFKVCCCWGRMGRPC